MRIKGTVSATLYAKNGFYVYGVVPDKEYLDKLKINHYGGITISGSGLPELTRGKSYSFIVELDTSNPKYRNSYKAEMDLDDFEISEIEAKEFLKEVTSGYLIDSIYEAYPNFATLILEGRADEINLKNIKGVKQKRFDMIKEKIEDKFKYYQVVIKYPEYKLSIEEAKKMFHKEPVTQTLYNSIDKNPYHWLINVCGRSFVRADELICNKDKKWLTDDLRMEYCMLEILDRNEYDGNTCINANVMAKFCKELTPECYNPKTLKGIAVESGLIYYEEKTKRIAKASTYIAESYISEVVKTLFDQHENLGIDWTKYVKTDEYELTDEQSMILELANEENVMILKGYAGSGKTTSMRALINMLEDNNLSYTLVAPTGLASKRLSESTKRKATTIHRQIQLNPSTGVLRGEIVTKFLICDEMSMCDVKLLKALLESIRNKDYTKVVFVCDDAQLPSIGAGNCMSDLIRSGFIPTASLTKIFRYGIGGISTVATKVRNGEDYLDGSDIQYIGKDKGYKFVQINDNPFQQVMDEFEKLLDEGYSPDDIMILSPFNVGEIGTYEINLFVQTLINPLGRRKEWSYKRGRHDVKFRVGDKVLNITNTYDALTIEKFNKRKNMEREFMYDDFYEDDEEEYIEDEIPPVDIVNGDTGYVRSIVEDGDDNYMVVQFDENMVVYEKPNLNNLLLGNSLSTHKSQGSQSKVVITIASSIHKKMLNANLLYVADTRAQEKMIEIGDYQTINEAIRIVENLNRETFLRDLIINSFKK